MSAQTIVIQGIARPSSEQLRRLGRFGVATVHEALGRGGLMNPVMRPIYSGAKIAGAALTVLGHPGDNTMLHVAATVCRPGDIIVVALSSECNDGMLGDLLATSFRANGVIGVVLDAGCRDVAALTGLRRDLGLQPRRRLDLAPPDVRQRQARQFRPRRPYRLRQGWRRPNPPHLRPAPTSP